MSETSTGVPGLETAAQLLQEGRWTDALRSYEILLSKDQSPDVLRGMADALWWTGDFDGAIAYYRRAYAGFRRRGEDIAAARVAIALCVTYKCCLTNASIARGWLARAEATAAANPSPLQGWFMALRGYLLMDSDLNSAMELLQSAIDYARLTADRDLELVALGDLGLTMSRLGRLDEGLELIDQSMAGVSAGEHSRMETVVFVCCIMLYACEVASDLERVTHWFRVTDEFIERFGCPFLFSECRTFYGGILAALGRWRDAERELQTAVALTRNAPIAMRLPAMVYLARLRLRQGRLEEAEEALAEVANELAAGVVAAEIKLVRGDAANALAILLRVLRHYDDESVMAVQALELSVTAHLALGHLVAARSALGRLGEVMRRRPRAEAEARYALAAGRVALAEGHAAEALRCFEQAADRFSRLELPYEAARARLQVVRALGEEDSPLAISEARAALRTFDELGATLDGDEAAARLRALGVAGRPGPKNGDMLTEREQDVLRLLAHGMSNPEIAERLFISRKTAAHHVSSVLSKLDLRNRAEAVAYATRAHLGEPSLSGQPVG